jgi:hypothetical protein
MRQFRARPFRGMADCRADTRSILGYGWRGVWEQTQIVMTTGGATER